MIKPVPLMTFALLLSTPTTTNDACSVLISCYRLQDVDELPNSWSYRDALTAWVWVNSLSEVLTALVELPEPTALRPLMRHVADLGEQVESLAIPTLMPSDEWVLSSVPVNGVCDDWSVLVDCAGGRVARVAVARRRGQAHCRPLGAGGGGGRAV